MKVNSFNKQKHGYLIHICLDKAFKGTGPSFLEGSLPVYLTLILEPIFTDRVSFCQIPENVALDFNS